MEKPMKPFRELNPCVLGIVIAASVAMTPSTALSQEAEGAEEVEEIVVTGTRKEGQSPTETLSPIDVFGGTSLSDQATFDMTDGLSKIAPSFNTQRFPVADGTAFIRPAVLRNLSPDHTLVLVNGTRRHRSPLVNLQFAPLGTVNQGAQAVDYASIPPLAVKRIEVLRDGASAQYGSDAIAGVINVILKDADEGFTVSAQTGEYFDSDGTRTTFAANGGFSMGGNGFLNLTVEYSEADRTSRGGPWFACPDIIAALGSGGAAMVPLEGNCIRWGDPDVEALKFFANFGIDVSDNVEIFANASYSDNETIGDFFYRHPVLPPAAMIGAHSSLMTDRDGDFLPDPAPQSLVDEIIAAGSNPSDLLTADAASPSGFVLLNPIFSTFPGGFNPDFGAELSDYAFVFGARGVTGGGLSWDVRGRVAEAEVDYLISSTVSPALGALSPTSFRPGVLTQEETAFTADFVKPYDVGNLASPLNVAFGFEFRDETYEIDAGDPASIAVGPTSPFFGFGSNGFQGFPTESAGSFGSESIAVYLDLEADLTDRFSGGAAIRYEDYDTFGDTFDWKLSGRFEVTDTFALRGTVNTGFRAPTPGQVNTLNTTTSADATGTLIPSTVFPVNSTAAIVLGSKPLVPEESTAFTIGAVFQPTDNTAVTLDYYDIEIEDRLALIGPNTVTALDVADLTAAGVPNANLLLGTLAGFFVNGFDSDVTGIDLAITSDFEVGPGTLTVDLRHNFNEQEVSRIGTIERPGRPTVPAINAARAFDLENQVPENRTTLTLNYQTDGMFGGYLRLNNYDGWETTEGLFSGGTAAGAASYGSEILVDVEATFTFAERFRVSVGGENVFDTDPDAEQGGTLGAIGVRKALTSPFGFNGGFWYVRATADF
ncbi:MAG: TonB-dependent receptor plug domain-containing protein [Woeseiaceae bacterium]